MRKLKFSRCFLPLVVSAFCLASVRPAFAGTPIWDHMLGSWQGTDAIWTFHSELDGRVSKTTTHKFLDEKRRAFFCRVNWEGKARIQMCSELSREKGFCYNKGRVAKYFFSGRWNALTLIDSPANDIRCAEAVSRLGSGKLETSAFILPLAPVNQNETWFGQARHSRI
ncbi:MAG: hypothetical protein HC902_06530 [Calothrix sp. SM1_5_4]|nr:hypothetical protein [Calothrix sp. SM1_5_4]